MSLRALLSLSFLALATAPALARAQDAPAPSLVAPAGSPPAFSYVAPQSMSGPRVGLIYFQNGITRYDSSDDRTTTTNLMSIFGWQIEDQSFQLANGLSGMTEFVASVAGIDQHLFLPAASLLLALRTKSGAEIALGPTVSTTELNLTLAVGRSYNAGGVRFPINAALVASATGARISITTGWISDR